MAAPEMVEWVQEGNIECVKAAVGADSNLANSKRSDGVPVICLAVAKGDSKIVETLLENGAAVDAGAEFGGALHVAVQDEQEEIVKTFLRYGANANFRNRWGQTPLHKTTKNQQATIAKLLLEHGADASAVDSKGRTPLHRCQSRPVAEVLIAAGADVGAQDHDGFTPLHWAAQCKSESESEGEGESESIDRPTVELLLEKGADPEVKDNEGRTVRALAEEKGQTALIEILDARKA